ncbi:hypothetical protein N825_23550 [Skermanella stibiiresistens SB22]|uniref:Lysozyme inhibitor LprI N-terminal domain-containing protein n=1 Tax=Skermanella stibiiresistens SB22 TaxID=1385369 RepID=W9HAQ6_9PROT|nr:hypothetical protein N825_23550 [Skermanella stibiiresistens SB22]
MICGDGALSRLDEAMAAEYSRARAAVSEDGRRQLRDNQRSWLKYVSATCVGSKEALQCLRDAYQDRRDGLGKVPVKMGPFTFIPVESFGFEKAAVDDDGGMVTGWTIDLRRYPRIDAPATREAAAWNAAVAARSDATAQAPRLSDDDAADESGIDAQESFDIHSASSDLISMSSEGYVYPHGAAHGTEGAQTSNHLLSMGRELEPADLFNPRSGWRGFLADRCFAGLSAQAEADGWTLDTPEPAALVATASDPKNWEITGAALTIRFSVYEVGPYSASMPKVAIPWADLKPYLAASPVLPIPPR